MFPRESIVDIAVVGNQTPPLAVVTKRRDGRIHLDVRDRLAGRAREGTKQEGKEISWICGKSTLEPLERGI
jgi:hypothetical protein